MNAKYAEYLASEGWRRRREYELWQARHRCRNPLCKIDAKSHSRVHLDVHHITYARLGAEAVDDVIVLCRACHARQHGEAPPFIGPSYTWADDMRAYCAKRVQELRETEPHRVAEYIEIFEEHANKWLVWDGYIGCFTFDGRPHPFLGQPPLLGQYRSGLRPLAELSGAIYANVLKHAVPRIKQQCPPTMEKS